MQFAPVKDPRTVRRWYPFAVKIVRVPGGYLAFFNMFAYHAWRGV